MNCKQYREAGRWPEPLSFHEFPTDLERKKLWVEVINCNTFNERKYSLKVIFQALRNEEWVPKDKGKVCSMHFDMDDYRETSNHECTL